LFIVGSILLAHYAQVMPWIRSSSWGRRSQGDLLGEGRRMNASVELELRALDQGASAPNTVLGFAVQVGLGVAGAGWDCSATGRQSSPQAA
jgi:hypothetical protein